MCHVVELAGDSCQSSEEEFGGKEGHDGEEDIVDELGLSVVVIFGCFDDGVMTRSSRMCFRLDIFFVHCISGWLITTATQFASFGFSKQ